MEIQVWAEVLTVGSELVLGQLVDTNASFIARELSEIGVGLAFHTTVGDDKELMRQAFKTSPPALPDRDHHRRHRPHRR